LQEKGELGMFSHNLPLIILIPPRPAETCFLPGGTVRSVESGG
jgi:hypothetical protein